MQILGDVIDNGSDLSSTEEANLIQLISQLLQVYCVGLYYVRDTQCVIPCAFCNSCPDYSVS